MWITEYQAKRNEIRHGIYQAGGLMTVRRGEETITSYLVEDEEGDLILRHAGAITNVYGSTIDDDGWNIIGYAWHESPDLEPEP